MITKEELLKRKEILKKRIKEILERRLEEENNDKEIIRVLNWSINEIDFWLDYIEIKEANKQEPKSCFRCKKFRECKVRMREGLVDGIFENCALFEEAEDGNKK